MAPSEDIGARLRAVIELGRLSWRDEYVDDLGHSKFDDFLNDLSALLPVSESHQQEQGRHITWDKDGNYLNTPIKVSESHSDRLRALAIAGARKAHGNLYRGTNGHKAHFKACPHPDCVFARALIAEDRRGSV